MVYVTGDCHANFARFSMDSFPEQKEMTRDDFVIVCGDFGIWHDDWNEQARFDELEAMPFTLLFVDGNHENFDRLYSDEFPVVDFHGGKAHKIRENIYHLMRGYVFELCGKKFFAFGGARSHDIQDGIVEPDDYPDDLSLYLECRKRSILGEIFRVNHRSWWKEEMPSREEMEFGLKTLEANDNKVDFVIAHCCPQYVVAAFSHGRYEPDELTTYFNQVADEVEFRKWFFGHYHSNETVMHDFVMLYDRIERCV